MAGAISTSISTPFDPTALRVTREDGRHLERLRVDESARPGRFGWVPKREVDKNKNNFCFFWGVHRMILTSLSGKAAVYCYRML